MKQAIIIIFFSLIPFSGTYAGTWQEKDSIPDAWALYINPGETHRFLGKQEGTWTEEVSIWMKPDEEPEKYTLTCVISMEHGGRYQQSSHTGEMAGMLFEGTSYLGFNNADKKFTMTAINNIGTGTLVLEGSWTIPGKTISLTGTMTSPGDKEKISIRQVITYIDKDTFMIENYDRKGNGEEYKSMEYKFSRQ
jgi:hypothetical protein